MFDPFVGGWVGGCASPSLHQIRPSSLLCLSVSWCVLVCVRVHSRGTLEADACPQIGQANAC